MAEEKFSTVLVFTDVHFNAEKGRDAIPHQRFRDGLAHAARYQPDASRIIITGDLTDEGDVASFELLKEALEAAHAPVSLMIGNHDRRENFKTVFPQAPLDENGFVQQVLDEPNASLVLLDTLFAPPYDYPKSHSGRLCEERLAWLDRELERADKPVVIFMHHPPHKTHYKGMDFIRLGNEEEFWAVVEKHANVRQIIAGHIHRTISGSHRGVPFAIFKSTQWQMPMLRDEPNVHVSVDEPPAYGMLDIGPESVIVNTEDFGLTDYGALDIQTR